MRMRCFSPAAAASCGLHPVFDQSAAPLERRSSARRRVSSLTRAAAALEHVEAVACSEPADLLAHSLCVMQLIGCCRSSASCATVAERGQDMHRDAAMLVRHNPTRGKNISITCVDGLICLPQKAEGVCHDDPTFPTLPHCVRSRNWRCTSVFGWPTRTPTTSHRARPGASACCSWSTRRLVALCVRRPSHPGRLRSAGGLDEYF